MTKQKRQRTGRISGQNDLAADLKHLVNRPESSDLVFKCKDGESVHASRWLLSHRCTVFRRMLSNGMMETQVSEIPLENFSSAVMLSIVEYLYTGAIESHPPVSWRMGLELLSAAHFFDVPKVETIAQRYLWSKVFTKSTEAVEISQALAMDMLSVALEFEETWDRKADVMDQLSVHIGDEWFQNNCSSMMSRDAVDFMLRRSRPNATLRANRNGSYLDEYLTFRKIVLWLAYRVLLPSDAKAETIREALPGRDSPSLWRKLVKVPDIDRYLSELSTSTDARSSTGVLNSLVGARVCKKPLEYLLMRHVTLSRIPPSLLLEIVYPLQIFSLRQLLMALLYTGLERPVWYAPGLSLYLCSLRIGAGERVIRSFEHTFWMGTSMAVFALPETRSTSSCTWIFKIRHLGISCIDFGVICEPAGRPLRLYEIRKQALGLFPSRALRVDGESRKTLVSRRGRGIKGKKTEDVEEKSENEGKDSDEEQQNPDEEERNSDEEETISDEDGQDSDEEETSSKHEQRNWEVFDTYLGYESEVTFTMKASERSLEVEFSNQKAIWDDVPGGIYYPMVCFKECPRDGTSAVLHFKLLHGFDNC